MSTPALLFQGIADIYRPQVVVHCELTNQSSKCYQANNSQVPQTASQINATMTPKAHELLTSPHLPLSQSSAQRTLSSLSTYPQITCFRVRKATHLTRLQAHRNHRIYMGRQNMKARKLYWGNMRRQEGQALGLY